MMNDNKKQNNANATGYPGFVPGVGYTDNMEMPDFSNTNRSENNSNTGCWGYPQNAGNCVYPQSGRLAKPLMIQDGYNDLTVQTGYYAVKAVNNLRNAMAQSITVMDDRLKRVEKRPKMKVTKSVIQKMNDGTYMLSKVYENGTFGESKPLFNNVKGEFTPLLLKFSESYAKGKKYILLTWRDSGKRVICDSEKMTGDKLYNCFVEAGIVFCPWNSKRQVKEALYDWFAPSIKQIANSEANVFKMSGNAGWAGNERIGYEWNSAEEWSHYDFRGLPDLPVQHKRFNSEKFDKKLLEVFFGGFSNIENEQYRILLLEMLVHGILASILNEEELYSEYFLNLILMDGILPVDFCRLYQIFNRGDWKMVEANDKKICNYLQSVKDEIVLLHKPTVPDSNYDEKKIQNNLEQIIDKICYRNYSSMGISGEIHVGLVILNAQVIPKKAAINIVVDAECFKTSFFDMLKSSAVDAFLSAFIRYAEKEMSGIKGIIRKWKKTECENKLWDALFEILGDFGTKEEIDVYGSLQVSPELRTSEIWDSSKKISDLEELIIRIIRSRMKNFYILKKEYGFDYIENCCYYDENYLWIPVKIFKDMMDEGNLSGDDSKMQLIEWKNQKVLIPDDKGLTYRLRFAQGKSLQTYCFKKSLFNSEFDAPIEELGKEVQ